MARVARSACCVLIGAALVVVLGIVVWFFRVPSAHPQCDDQAIVLPLPMARWW